MRKEKNKLGFWIYIFFGFFGFLRQPTRAYLKKNRLVRGGACKPEFYRSKNTFSILHLKRVSLQVHTGDLTSYPEIINQP